MTQQGNSCWRGRIARLFRNIRINYTRCSAARRVRSNRTLVVSFLVSRSMGFNLAFISSNPADEQGKTAPLQCKHQVSMLSP